MPPAVPATATLTTPQHDPHDPTNRYNGYRSATTFVTNFLLLAQRLSTSVVVSRDGYSKVLAQSINLVENLTFNIVTHEHVGRSLHALQSAPPPAIARGAGAEPARARALDVLGVRRTSRVHARLQRHVHGAEFSASTGTAV